MLHLTLRIVNRGNTVEGAPHSRLPYMSRADIRYVVQNHRRVAGQSRGALGELFAGPTADRDVRIGETTEEDTESM